jgi:hypothetical protein
MKTEKEVPNERFIERNIVTGLIVSTEYIQKIKEFWNDKYLESETARTVARWCIDHFDKYKVAPNRQIENIYNKKLQEGKLAKALLSDIEEEILPSLSKEYENSNFNLQFLLDQTNEYFIGRHLTLHTEQIEGLKQSGQTEEAQKLAKEFKPFEFTAIDTLDQFIWSIEDIRSHDRKKPRLLMKPWLREGQTTFVYGNYGCGKSLLTIAVAYLLGLNNTDDEKCDIGEWQVKHRTGCLYIDGELGEQEMEERISKFEWLGKQHSKTKLRILPIPEYQIATNDQFYLSDRKNQIKIVQWLKNHPSYKLVVLDSSSTLFGLQDENSSSEWNTKINPLLRDFRALDVACILLHHSGKDVKKGLRGSSAMGAMAHNIFRLTDHPDKNIDDGKAWFVLTKDKQRAGGFSFNSFALCFSQNSDYTETFWEITEGSKAMNKGLNAKELRVLKHYIDGRLNRKQIAEEIRCSGSYVTEIKKKLIKKGFLNSDGEPTDVGKDIVEAKNEDDSLE